MNYKDYEIIDDGLFLKVLKDNEKVLTIKRFCDSKGQKLTEEETKKIFDAVVLPIIERTK